MIPGADIFDHGGGPFGEKPGEKNSAFDLCAGNRCAVGNALQIAMALDHQRWTGFFAHCVEVCAHEAQRIDHALHRAPGQRGVAGESGGEILRCENAGHEPHRGAGVAAVEVSKRLGEAA